ncbi:Stalked cell differentiation-controlling protein [Thiorhodovibrio winogradskyi]|uniref:Stalked cell differentiation-controlling protein n=1 Tax=Thiorhodovibrio winogradskyi TaxID=77007 RepID=A0ABZ0S770_9GAMM|nr:response regulator [Thiorhodovibrio winogradskyi]
MDPKPSILIVDDEPANIDLLRAQLGAGYRIRAATSGARALAAARKAPPPDLLLLDAMMPELDGFGLCEQLRADPTTAALPVIFISGSAAPADRARAAALGARDYLTKPVATETLLAAVQAALAPI